ncbi:MAG TPA: DUF4062 domain-containing protein [Longimicrobium sp.]|jgi:hypothetical protein
MPRIETVFRLFVASPSDVAEERAVVDEVVSELNLTWSKHLALRIEVIKWETHAFPAMGADAQSVINHQIADDYDIFLGLLWTRFGTPTPRSDSGTGEEFQRAYDRFRADPSALRIMFYFKTAPIDPTSLDPDQLKRINDFREQLGPKGTLYWTFAGREDFATLLRIHLSRQVQELAAAADSTGASVMLQNAREALGTAQSNFTESSDEDEAGFLDLVKDGVEGFEAMSGVLTELTLETRGYTSRIVERTKEMEAAVAIAADDPRPMWRAAKAYADDMETFAARLDQQRPRFAAAADQAFSSLSGALALSTDFARSEESLLGILTNLRGLISANIESRGVMADFRDTVATQPRISTPTNRARRKFVAAMDRLLEELDRTIGLGKTVEQETLSLLDLGAD